MAGPTKEDVLKPSFLSMLGRVHGKKVIDLGCGSGYFTRIIAQAEPHKVIGIDLSRELIKIARKLESRTRLGIEYYTQDIIRFETKNQFQIAAAVYLLNYAKNEKVLSRMCKKIYDFLANRGRLVAITMNPGLKPMRHFEYGRKFTGQHHKPFFVDGERLRGDHFDEAGKAFYFYCYYYSSQTYERCLRAAGFKNIRWVPLRISQAGVQKFGSAFWEKHRENSVGIGVTATK
ncbi:MAG: class I SAM-dependent methyltransferase [Candidatus Kerfeldbacteria bacterium]|nr:class I SAM-dependent methyltransferase [Candidatus Kerfeldbacteria bacterium]